MKNKQVLSLVLATAMTVSQADMTALAAGVDETEIVEEVTQEEEAPEEISFEEPEEEETPAEEAQEEAPVEAEAEVVEAVTLAWASDHTATANYTTGAAGIELDSKGATGSENINYTWVVKKGGEEVSEGITLAAVAEHPEKKTFSTTETTAAGEYKVIVTATNAAEGAAADDKLEREFTITVTNYTYKIAFNANGGTGTMTDEAVTLNTAKTLPANTITRTGFKFKGWATTATGEKEYNDAASVPFADVAAMTATEGVKTLTLYAVWVEAPVVTFDMNGGDSIDANGSSISEGKITYEKGEDFGTLPKGVWADHDFVGWSLDGKGTSDTVIKSSDKVTFTENTTLKAVYTVKQSTVTYDLNGVADAKFRVGESGVSLSDKTKKYDYTAKYGELPVASKAGKQFLGWNYSGTVSDEDPILTADSPVKKAATTTLYACWADQVTATFALDGGNINGVTTDVTVNLDKGTKLTNENVPTPVKSGYKFVTWKKDDAAVADVTVDAINVSTTFTAVWEKCPQFIYTADEKYAITTDKGAAVETPLTLTAGTAFKFKVVPSKVTATGTMVVKCQATGGSAETLTPDSKGVYTIESPVAAKDYTITVTGLESTGKTVSVTTPASKGALYSVYDNATTCADIKTSGSKAYNTQDYVFYVKPATDTVGTLKVEYKVGSGTLQEIKPDKTGKCVIKKAAVTDAVTINVSGLDFVSTYTDKSTQAMKAMYKLTPVVKDGAGTAVDHFKEDQTATRVAAGTDLFFKVELIDAGKVTTAPTVTDTNTKTTLVCSNTDKTVFIYKIASTENTAKNEEFTITGITNKFQRTVTFTEKLNDTSAYTVKLRDGNGTVALESLGANEIGKFITTARPAYATITPATGYKIKSVMIGDAKVKTSGGEYIIPEATAAQSVVVETEASYSLTVAAPTTPVAVKANGKINLDPYGEKTITLVKGAAGKNITKISIMDGKTELVASGFGTLTSNTYKITSDKLVNYAGKTLKVSVYDTAGDDAKPCYTFSIGVNASDLKSVAVAGTKAVKNTTNKFTLAQTAGTTQYYKITANPTSVPMSNFSVAVDDSVGTAATATIQQGNGTDTKNYYLKVVAAKGTTSGTIKISYDKDGAGAGLAAEKMQIALTTNTDIVKNYTPVAKVSSVSYDNAVVTVTNNNKNINAMDSASLFYAVKATRKTSATDSMNNVAYAVVAYTGATQDIPLALQSDSDSSTAVASQYDIEVYLVQSASALTIGTTQTEYDAAKAVGAAKISKVKKLSTKTIAPAYAKSINLKAIPAVYVSDNTSIATAANASTGATIVTTTFDNKCTFGEITSATVVGTNKMTVNVAANKKDVRLATIDADIPSGTYTIQVEALQPNSATKKLVKTVKVNVVNMGRAADVRFKLSSPTNVYKTANKAVTVDASVKTTGLVVDSKAAKAQIKSVDYALTTIPTGSGITVAKNGKVTLPKNYTLSASSERVTVTATIHFKNSSNTVAVAQYFDVQSKTAVPKSIEITSLDTSGNVNLKDLAGKTITVYDADHNSISDVTWKTNNTNSVWVAGSTICVSPNAKPGTYTFTATTADGTKKSVALKVKTVTTYDATPKVNGSNWSASNVSMTKAGATVNYTGNPSAPYVINVVPVEAGKALPKSKAKFTGAKVVKTTQQTYYGEYQIVPTAPVTVMTIDDYKITINNTLYGSGECKLKKSSVSLNGNNSTAAVSQEVEYTGITATPYVTITEDTSKDSKYASRATAYANLKTRLSITKKAGESKFVFTLAPEGAVIPAGTYNLALVIKNADGDVISKPVPVSITIKNGTTSTKIQPKTAYTLTSASNDITLEAVKAVAGESLVFDAIENYQDGNYKTNAFPFTLTGTPATKLTYNGTATKKIADKNTKAVLKYHAISKDGAVGAQQIAVITITDSRDNIMGYTISDITRKSADAKTIQYKLKESNATATAKGSHVVIVNETKQTVKTVALPSTIGTTAIAGNDGTFEADHDDLDVITVYVVEKTGAFAGTITAANAGTDTTGYTVMAKETKTLPGIKFAQPTQTIEATKDQATSAVTIADGDITWIGVDKTGYTPAYSWATSGGVTFGNATAASTTLTGTSRGDKTVTCTVTYTKSECPTYVAVKTFTLHVVDPGIAYAAGTTAVGDVETDSETSTPLDPGTLTFTDLTESEWTVTYAWTAKKGADATDKIIFTTGTAATTKIKVTETGSYTITCTATATKGEKTYTATKTFSCTGVAPAGGGE